MELPNSCASVELGLDEMPLTLRVESQVPHSPIAQMSPFHVIFYLNGVLVVTHFDRGGYHKAPSRTIILQPRLKEFLNKCVAQFHMYIWPIAYQHNIYNYLDQIWHKTQISIDVPKCAPFIHYFSIKTYDIIQK